MDVPPERIELPAIGVVLRRHRPDDLDALHAVIEENRDHLRPFMPWADQARADTSTFLDGAVERWEQHTDFGYVIEGNDGTVLGGCGIHRRGAPDTAEIGYWLAARAIRRGIVTTAVAALADAAMALDGVERVEIRCDEANTRSAAVPRRLGFRLDRIEADHISAPGDLGRSMIWSRSTDGATNALRVRRSAQHATDSSV